MATPIPDRPSRYLYLGGPVDTARARARRLALMATFVYALCLFAIVMLAHGLLDNAHSFPPEAQSPALEEQASRF